MKFLEEAFWSAVFVGGVFLAIMAFFSVMEAVGAMG